MTTQKDDTAFKELRDRIREYVYGPYRVQPVADFFQDEEGWRFRVGELYDK